MPALRIVATFAFVAVACGAVSSAPARAGELVLFPYKGKCPAGWKAERTGPIEGLTWCSGSRPALPAGNGAVTRTWIYEAELRQFQGQCPSGWIRSEGQTLQIRGNPAIFSLIGPNFGGDGKTTFALPRLDDAPPGAVWCFKIGGIFPSWD